MSSGSSGVMKVWFRRVKMSWMTSSPLCSRSMISVGDFGQPGVTGPRSFEQQSWKPPR